MAIKLRRHRERDIMVSELLSDGYANRNSRDRYTYGVVGEGFQIVAFPAMNERAKFQKKTCIASKRTSDAIK